jgi:predicted helicase
MMQENLALCVGRAGQVVGLEKLWNIVFCSDSIEDFNLFYRGGNVNCPLYLYPDTDKKDLFSHKIQLEKRKPNISPKLFTTLAQLFKKEPIPEEVFFYIYATLYSNTYRTKYAEFLKTDFPRIPFTKNYKLFCKMGEYGEKLVDLHLLKSNELDRPIAKFQGKADNKVERVKYGQGKVHINNDQHFEGISPEVWQYQIGGYQVCDKWLKDRKGRILSLDDIKHYCKVATALKKTIEVQEEIDIVYTDIEKEIIEF